MIHVAGRVIQIVTASTLRRNILLTVGRQALAAMAQLLLAVLIARALGPEGNGLYAIAILLPNLLVSFLNLGVGPATVYFISRGDVRARHAILENCKLAGMIAVIGVALTLPIITLWGNQLFPGVPLTLLQLGLVAFPISLILAFLTTVFQGLEDFRSYNWCVLIPPYVSLLGVYVALYPLALGVVGALGGYLVGQAACLVATSALLAKYLISDERSPEEGYKRRVLGYGYKAHLSNVLTFVNYRADIFLVNLFLSPAATGVYVIAVQIAERLWLLSKASSTVLLPRFSAMHDDPTARINLAHKGFWLISGLTAVGAVIVTMAMDVLLEPIFGYEYGAAFLPYLWLLPGIVAGAGARIYANTIAATGKPEWNMYVALGVVFLNVIGNIILIPRYGIAGAAIATSIVYLFDAVIKGILVRMTTQATSIY